MMLTENVCTAYLQEETDNVEMASAASTEIAGDGGQEETVTVDALEIYL